MLKLTMQAVILDILRERFDKFQSRHASIAWQDVEGKLLKNPEKLHILEEMERTGGEPDVVEFDRKTKDFVFFDCAAETPKLRCNFCYDQEALNARKSFKPKDSAVHFATELGISILTEEQYCFLQTLGEFDTKTSSWLQTPAEIRELGGAIFGDRRFNRVFIYHNGAESYYSSRGFRGSVRV